MAGLKKSIDIKPVKMRTVKISDIKRKPMHYMKEVEQKMRAELMVAEDQAIFDALDNLDIDRVKDVMKL